MATVITITLDYRLDNTKHFSRGLEKDSPNRNFYVFIQPTLRANFSWNIIETGYRNTF